MDDRRKPRPDARRESGVEVDAVGAQLWTIADGKGRNVKLYQSKADALEAAGMGE